MANGNTYQFFCFLVYNEDWAIHEVFDCCVKSCLPCYISPLHNQDIYDESALRHYLFNNNKSLFKGLSNKSTEQLFDLCCSEGGKIPEWKVGELKKPHWHILVQLPRKYSLSNALPVIQSYFPLLDINYIESADYDYCSKYWSHLNAPSKAQYNPKDAIAVNGFVPDLSFPQGMRPKNYPLLDVMAYINSNKGVTLYKVLYHFQNLACMPDVVSYIEKHTYLICRLIDEKGANYDSKI